MYLIDFFKRAMRASNIPIIIYLVLNVFVIIGMTFVVLLAAGSGSILLAAGVGLGLYIISLMITLSPIGEWVLRVQNGCKKLVRREHKEYLLPLFNEVYERAREQDPTIAPDVQLFINDDESMNAFATGRKTICVTKGLMNLPPEQIKAVLAHEFGHLSHKDTDLILIISVGNFFVTAFILVMRAIITLINTVLFFGSLFNRDAWGMVQHAVIHFLELALISGISWLWTQLGVLLCMKSSRSNEFLADEFSFQLGYGTELCYALDTVAGGHGAEGLFATLVSSHPDKDQRVGRLQELEDAVNNGTYTKKLLWVEDNIQGLEDDDTVKLLEDDSVKPQDDSIKLNDDSVKPEDDTVKLNDDTVKPEDNKPKKVLNIELQCLSGEFSGMSFPIVEDEQILIGRDPAQANIILNNPHISRKHCIIRYFEPNNVFYVTDQSSYGTFFKDGEKLPKGRCIEVKPGTVLYLGDKEEAFLLVCKKD